jgi:hypothetical protein
MTNPDNTKENIVTDSIGSISDIAVDWIYDHLYWIDKDKGQIMVSELDEMNFIFNDNVRILCLSCNVKKVGKLVRFKQKEQKQTSFLAFHKCCQGCLLRGPRYINVYCIFLHPLISYFQDLILWYIIQLRKENVSTLIS